ncbi:hypothetical protein P9052_24165, partial [Bacillus cereus]|nr:hypothetical protein [Bacillus cereus]
MKHLFAKVAANKLIAGAIGAVVATGAVATTAVVMTGNDDSNKDNKEVAQDNKKKGKVRDNEPLNKPEEDKQTEEVKKTEENLNSKVQNEMSISDPTNKDKLENNTPTLATDNKTEQPNNIIKNRVSIFPNNKDYENKNVTRPMPLSNSFNELPRTEQPGINEEAKKPGTNEEAKKPGTNEEAKKPGTNEEAKKP